MKKIQKGLFLISLCCLLMTLSGCGETRADKEYAKNPQDYVLKELKEKYAIEAIVEKEETKVYNEKNGKIEYEYFVLSLKDDKDFKFNAVTMWEMEERNFNRHYKFATNYASFINYKLLTEYFNNYPKIKFIGELGEVSDKTFLRNYEMGIYIDDTNYLNEIPSILISAQNSINSLYDVNLNVKSNGKVATIMLKPRHNSRTLEEITKDLEKLK